MSEDLEKAKVLLEQEKQQRAERCKEELDALLQRPGCRLDVAMVLKPGEVPAVVVQIVAL